MKNSNVRELKWYGLPVIENLEDFSRATNISKHTIYQLSKYSNKYYKVYSIPKSNGKQREICQPSKRLKGLQAWILVNVLNKLKVSASCKGFEKGTSIADNASAHQDADVVLSMDLENFFPSIKRLKVYNVFRSIGYNSLIATVMTNLCTYEGFLPQGSPCSPKLANIISFRLDARIQGYVGKKGIVYTRYADDLTFSGINPASVVRIIPTLKTIIKDEGFRVNKHKTRIAGIARCKTVTGLVLYDSTYGIGSEKYRKLRAKIHHLTLPIEQENIKLLYEVKGWLAYLNSVDTKRLGTVKRYIERLSKVFPDTLVAEL